jgi:hypothetical protein
VLREATPLTKGTGEPMSVAPSRNVTVPVGVPPALDTVADRVMFSPLVEGVGETLRAVDVAAPVTVTVWELSRSPAANCDVKVTV